MNIEEILAAVAKELEWMQPPPVFIGGATIGAYLDTFGRTQLRPTKDVDLIVPGVTNRMAWPTLEAELGRRGWTPDAEGPICRHLSPSGHLVDLLATWQGAWFPGAVRFAAEHTLSDGTRVRLPDVAWLLGCKIDAFRDRGSMDPLASQDLEDVIAILDGCDYVAKSLAAAPLDLKEFVGRFCARVRDDRSLLDAAMAHLPRGEGDQARRERLRTVLSSL